MSTLQLSNSIFLASLDASKGFVKIKRPTIKQMASGEVQLSESRYTHKSLNKLLKNTDFILTDITNVGHEYGEAMRMVSLAHQRKFIPVYCGENASQENYNSISFGVFAGSTPAGDKEYVFCFLSMHTDQMDVEDELEEYAVDDLNDLYASCAGKDYALVVTYVMKQTSEALNHAL